MPHAPAPLRHLMAPAALHRRTHAHEPRLPAAALDVAGGILGEDVTQIEVYPNASSGWWARFTFNGITRYDQGAYDLVGGEELCRQRLDAFHMQRGEEVACLLIEKPAASCTAAATCQFLKRSSTARIRLGRD